MSHPELTHKSIEDALSYSFYPDATHPFRNMTMFGRTGNPNSFTISDELFPGDLVDGLAHPDRPPNQAFQMFMTFPEKKIDEIELTDMPCIVERIPPTIDTSINDRERDDAFRKQFAMLLDSVHVTYITGVGVALVQDNTTIFSLMHFREGLFVHPSIAGQTPVEPSPHWRFRTPGKPFRLVKDDHGIRFSTVLSWLPPSNPSPKPDSRLAFIGNLRILHPTIERVDKTIIAFQRTNTLNDTSLRSVITCSLSIASLPKY